MDLCPLCNGLESKVILCPNCQSIMEDKGKITDYLDDYSAYMDIDIMKLFDGNIRSLENHKCMHYFFCPLCDHEETNAINE
ncbi:hypothetical protein [Metabacillus sediminilitoris]|uniref:Uncharacterized protein n=1 Tax=Metabacillus sediminilitoris TaxID=2567941 RepID=A0A4S4BY05_9BACI|nr:hypothetical protein [Metabacillus sediminilitoris]QGQ44500.1 hypothetical protein GMB29_04030 [Metabacillus sediminilitoris]THF80123.1 hypothetical protein E6W99_10645 [Metabacillus sediminilitoris]